MRKTILLLTVITICFFSLSCETGNSVDQGKPTLTVSENPIAIALNYGKSITVTGGTSSYRVKSISDSNIVSINFFPSYISNVKFSQTVNFFGKKLGTTKVVIQDSAKTAEVEIIVTVSVMASSPSAITVKTQRTKYASIIGGVYPYKISQPANSAIATVTLNGSSVMAEGVFQGSTSVTISDNSNPPNVLTIPITVTVPPLFTTAGKISFNYTNGTFETEGIYGASNTEDLPNNDAGAGGFVTKFSSSGNYGSIVGYKKKSATQVDFVLITFIKNEFAPSTISLDTGFSVIPGPRDYGAIMFGFDLVPYGRSNTAYSTFSGDMTFSSLSEQKAEGSFQGKAGLISNETGRLIPGHDVTISQGLFSVPLIAEDAEIGIPRDKTIFNQIEKLMQPQIEK